MDFGEIKIILLKIKVRVIRWGESRVLVFRFGRSRRGGFVFFVFRFLSV